MRIDHAAIGVRDLDQAIKWYRDVIGLREVALDQDRSYLGCGGRDEFDLRLERGEPGLRHIAYGCRSEEEFKRCSERLTACGLESLSSWSKGPGISAAVAVALPGGHRVEVVLREVPDRYPSLSQWGWDAVESPREIDHVNIAARDVAASVEAVKRALGLALSDLHIVDDAVVGAWLRAGDRHHDFAIINNRADGLHHVAYQLADAASVLRFADRLSVAGTPAEYGVGRHGPGSNVFLYVRDPSGNRIELCADMALVPAGSPHRVWEGKDLSIVNSLAPYGPPKAFWEIT